MLSLFKKKPELDSKSKAITLMYLTKAQNQLLNEMASGESMSEDELFCANHDINCLANAIDFLEKS